MPEAKRQCSTCIFFRDADLPGNGWCVHPKRQVDSDVKILVRNAELACRNTWQEDLWQDASSPATTSTNPSRPSRGIAFLNSRLDDEVTSVVDTGDRDGGPATPAPFDDVITATTIRDDRTDSQPQTAPPNDTNSGAVADQDERVRVMARGGSREAILDARKRHAQRRKAALIQSDAPPADPPRANDDATNPDQLNIAGASLASGNTSDARQEDMPPPSQSGRTPPKVSPLIDPSKLRSFMHGRETPPAEDSSAVPSHTNQFDHVLSQAQKIKQQTDRSRPRAAPKAANDDVWDVPQSELSTTIARAREAIYSAPSLDASGSDEPDVLANHAPGQASEVTPEPPQLSRADEPRSQFRVQANAVEPESTTEVLENSVVAGADSIQERAQPNDASFTDDEPDLDAIAFEAVPSVEIHDSPRASWWRSFNFGFGRRSRPQPEPMYEPYSDGEWDANDSDNTLSNDAISSSDDAYLTSEEEFNEDIAWPYVEEAQERSYSHANPQAINHEPESARATYFMSSEENWDLDSREFPEPQPAEWHASRNELLTQRDSPPPGPETRQQELLDDSWNIQAEYPVQNDEVTWVHPEPPIAVPPVHEPPPRRAFMDLARPEGLSDFRSALFGSEPETHASSEPAILADAPRQAEPPAELPYSPTAHQTALPPHRAGQSEEEAPSSHAPPVRHEAPPPVNRRRGTRNRPSRQAHQDRKAFPDLVEPETIESDAPAVPKACLTCRSYQPSDELDRGRCTNDHASTFRQIVDAQSLSCRSSFGDWWIRNDASWLPPESRITPETPRTDALASRSQPTDTLQSRQPRKGRTVRTRKTG